MQNQDMITTNTSDKKWQQGSRHYRVINLLFETLRKLCLMNWHVSVCDAHGVSRFWRGLA
jgi:hypothetical protein